MSSTNFDASLTTARRRQLALYAWRKEEQYPQNPRSLHTEQRPSYGSRGVGSTMDVPVNAYVGAQLVGQAPSTNPSSECGCSSGVTLQGDVKNAPGR